MRKVDNLHSFIVDITKYIPNLSGKEIIMNIQALELNSQVIPGLIGNLF